MIGRQVIKTNRAFTLEELEQFMQENWDKDHYNHFIIGRPTAASIEKYILLPATARFMVIAYSRKAGGLFNKDNKVILAVCDTPKGAEQDILKARAIPNKEMNISVFVSRGSMTKRLIKELRGGERK